MPKVTFVNEHRIVECEKGRLVSDVAAELGIAVCREAFRGTGIGGYSIWVKGDPGCVSEVGFLEKLAGAKGMRRMANRTKILGDVSIWTQPGLLDRLRAPRPVTAPPRPSEDPEAARLGVSAAGTSAYPFGHPQAVGKGTRNTPPVGAGKGKGKAAKATAKEAVAEEAESETESEEESE